MSICLPLVVMVVMTCWRCWPNVIITTVNISDCVKTDHISDCGSHSYVHNTDDNSHISGVVVGLRNTKQTLEPTWKLEAHQNMEPFKRPFTGSWCGRQFRADNYSHKRSL